MSSQQIRFVIAGAWNTLFGYLTGVVLYFCFEDSLPLFMILVLATVVSISMAFVINKLYVFRSRGSWIAEYVRAYSVYGVSAILSVAVVWVLVVAMLLPFWLAQAIATIFSAVISYVGNARFTFKDRAS
jgi:putative flippase GtrA